MIFYRSRYSADDYPMRPRHTGIDNAQTGGGAFSVPLQFVDLYFTNKGLRIEDDPDYFTYDTENPTNENVRTMLSTATYKDKFSGYTYFTPGSGYSVMKQFYNREPRFYLGITFQNRRWDFDNSRTYYTVMSFNGNSGIRTTILSSEPSDASLSAKERLRRVSTMPSSYVSVRFTSTMPRHAASLEIWAQPSTT